jgi:N-methylhydantoinase A
MLILGIDVGGTFTDLVVFDSETSEVRIHKVASTPPNFIQGIRNCLKEAKIDLRQAGRFIHGTTIATNTIVERKGAKTALVTTKGFRDVIEIDDCRRYGNQWDLKWSRIPPVVPRSLRFEIPERILHNGKIELEMKDEDILALVPKFREERVRAIAVCFLNSYINGIHEERCGKILKKNLPSVSISLSSEIPEMREFDRFSTIILNAYITPSLQEYINELISELREKGYKKEMFFMISSGGCVTEKSAAEYPVRFVLSGPAGAVSAGSFLAKLCAEENIITYDMGGTSSDICLIKNLNPTLVKEKLISHSPLRVLQLDINTIGAGGGSIAWVDLDGILRVGPQSAGASPGPACYSSGGNQFTVTDANLLLGRLGPTTLLGGAMRLNKALAQNAIQSLTEKTKVSDTYQLAEGVIKVTVTNMVSAIREVSIEQGHDPRDFTLFAGGGAGPMHAILMARDLGIKKVIVPNSPGNLSAFGLIVSDIKHDYVRTCLMNLNSVDISLLRGFWKEMVDEGMRALIAEGIPAERIDVLYYADMRYLGQSWALSIAVDSNFEIPNIERAFKEEYKKIYGYSREGMVIELVALRVVALGIMDKPILHKKAPKTSLSRAIKEERRFYFDGEFHDCVVYNRDDIPLGTSFKGPAIIEEFGSTTIVYPEWKITVDNLGQLILTSGLN